MKRKKRKVPLWKALTYSFLALIIGAVGGYLYGWHRGLIYAPPIIFMGSQYPVNEVT